MRFHFRRSILGSPGSLDITVIQPSDDMAGAIGNAKSIKLITTDTARSILFSGEAVTYETLYPDGVRTTSLLSMDGDAFNSSFASFTLSAGCSLYQLLEACASRGSTMIPIGSYPEFMRSVRLPRAVTVHGNAMVRIKQLAASVGAACFVQDGLLHLVPADVPTKSPARVSADTGLSGEPKKTDFGVVFQMQMRPFSLNDLVQIESDTLNGVFRIVASYGSGDTKSGEWKCTHTAIDNTVMAAKNSGIWR